MIVEHSHLLGVFNNYRQVYNKVLSFVLFEVMMSIKCSRCKSTSNVKNGLIQGKQRYRCRNCNYNYIEVDGRQKYDNKTKGLVIRMYLNNSGFRRISEILGIPLSTVFVWIKNAGNIVSSIVDNMEQEKENIEVLEMDELFTYVKKTESQCLDRRIHGSLYQSMGCCG